MAELLHKQYGVTVSRSTISRTLKRVGWTKKVVQNIAKERSPDLRDDYIERRSHYKLDQMVFIDESGDDRGLAILARGYAPKGVTPVQTKRFHRGKRVQILPAYTIDGVIYCEVYEDNTDVNVIEAFLENLLPYCGRYPEPKSPGEKILQELMKEVDYRQDRFNSDCILNDLCGVAFLLQTFKDDSFVSYRDESGVNCIALAAVEGHGQMIQFLHDKGGDLNNSDNRGRTPLMEAALWGRVKAVDILLERDADTRAKDRKGRRAYFYSRPSKKTARMRERLGCSQEKSDAEGNRRIIAVKLEVFEPVPTAGETLRSASPDELKLGRFITETTDWGTRSVITSGVSHTVCRIPSRR
ncbi:putative tpr domain-containing protein [Phaeoacremonium minimum UCRPA7]|uniref:Putative tpr domain-containing protein n=1 Tax=Phaeoacremonium minimum (strain UCR-PA7) TaxID=1286976 RepID=R8BUM7_PHAM7|nr:putative tpr domain-containing protein [Phaeoacremonium minimum UCRPA7]EOO03073.1 putative tpr domain-containing protein [Phaeoacremonium minimum UCRPA7]